MSTTVAAPNRLDVAKLRSLREIYAELGLALLSKGRNTEASVALEQALNEEGHTPDSAEIHLNLAVACEHAQQPDRAFKSYLQAVQFAPQRIREILSSAHKLLTPELAMTLGDWLEGEWQAQIRTEEIPSQSASELARLVGRVNLYQGRYEAAGAIFERALAGAPDDPRLWEGLGEAQWHLHKVAASLQTLTRAHELAGREPFADRLISINAKLARALEAEGRYEPALDRIADSLAEGDRFEAELLLMRSRCHLALGHPNEALEAAENAGTRDPRSVEARLLRSQALIALGRYQDALGVIGEASHIDPKRVEVRLYKAQALIEGRIDVPQGRRLLARYAQHAQANVPWDAVLQKCLAARKANSNALFFGAELNRAFGNLDEALKMLEDALQKGFGADTEYGDAPALQLKGELLQASGLNNEAAQSLFEAGRRFLWRKENEVAVEQLRHAVELNPNLPATFWYLADALRMQSYAPGLRPEERIANINESASAWNKSFQVGVPDRDNFWVYLTGAWINEQRINLFTSDLRLQRSWWWESVEFLERAILLHDQDEDSWTSLARSHRCLGNHINALEASSKAWELNPKSSSVQEERTAILAELGQLEEADQIIETRRSTESSAFADKLKAYILAEQHQYKSAILLLNEDTTSPEPDVWALDLRARCFRMAGDRKSAQRDYQRIWDASDRTNLTNQTSLASAGFYLGYFAEAAQILAESTELPDDGNANFYLGASLLAKGNLPECEKHLEAAVKLARRALQVEDTLFEDLPELELLSKSWPHAAEAGAILTRIRQKAEVRKIELASPISPEAELSAALDKLALSGELESGAWMGIYAGLGRLHLAAGRYSDAADSYGKLLNYRDRFPELSIATGQVAAAFQQAGDQFVKDGQFGQGLEAFRNGLAILADDSQDGRVQRANIQARLAIASVLDSKVEDARSELREWLPAARQAGLEHPGDLLAAVCHDLLKKPEHFWALDEEWADFASQQEHDSELARDLESARSALLPVLANWLELERTDSGVEPRIPIVIPIRMEIGPGLIPSDTSENWSLFKTYIPEMRDWFEQQMGVIVPGVRVRSNESLAADGYILQRDEHFVTRGRTYLNMRFFPGSYDALQAAGIPDADLERGLNPVTNQPGFWIPAQHWESVLARGLELWEEPLVFVIRHLQAILYQCLGDFLGVEEVNKLLASWENNGEHSALIKQVLPDEGAVLRFARLLRALAREQVPITNWQEILASVQSSGLDNIDEAVRAARIRIRKQLPGNRAGARRIQLPPEWNSAIRSWARQADGEIIFAPPPEEVRSFILMLGDLVPFGESNLALVVDFPPARPHLRHLIGSQFPGLMLLSNDELLPPDSSVTSAA